MTKKGFTLLEIVLTVSILVLTSSILAPIYLSTKSKDDLSSQVFILSSSLRRAQVLSITGQDDSSWGVKILPDNFVLFKGDTYSNRDVSQDEVIIINKNIVVEGLDEVVFSKVFGETNNVGEIIVKTGNDQIVLLVNKKGIIDY